MLLTTENSDVPSGISLVVDEMPSARSLLQIRKNRGPEPCGMPADTGVQEEF